MGSDAKLSRPCEISDDEEEVDCWSGEMKEASGKDGGSSSNSTVEESEKKPSSVRPYVRSKMPRLRWTPDLHLRFLHAVERLGGQERATPKLVLQLMNIKGLNIAHVKSHLQMFRSKKLDESNQGMNDHRFIMEGGDRNIYNLSQLPLLPTFNQRQNSNLMSFPRYGDSSWNGHGQWTHPSSIGQHTSNKTRPGFYNIALAEKILASRYIINRSSIDEDRSRQNPSHEPKDNKPRLPFGENGIKRKASEISYVGLDLNLSIGLESRNEEEDDEQQQQQKQQHELELSLYSTTTASKLIKKMKGDTTTDLGSGCENRKETSTLDLTL